MAIRLWPVATQRCSGGKTFGPFPLRPENHLLSLWESFQCVSVCRSGATRCSIAPEGVCSVILVFGPLEAITVCYRNFLVSLFWQSSTLWADLVAWLRVPYLRKHAILLTCWTYALDEAVDFLFASFAKFRFAKPDALMWLSTRALKAETCSSSLGFNSLSSQ